MRNKAHLDNLSMDNLYNNLKVYEAEIESQSTSSSNTYNVAFVSSENTSSTNEAVNTAHDHGSQMASTMLTMREKGFINKTGMNLKSMGKVNWTPRKSSGECSSLTEEQISLMIEILSGIKGLRIRIDSIANIVSHMSILTITTRPWVEDISSVNEIEEENNQVNDRFRSTVVQQEPYEQRLIKILIRGFVAFAGSPKGGKITRKGKIRTGKLDFENVYFVKELKFNLFSVSQMCDKKNSVLFTETECLILSPDFKCDNGTEFKNMKGIQFYKRKNSKTEFSVDNDSTTTKWSSRKKR
ncbi:hypothetical protein Tco_0801749 [Tanacetum coccineum]|uniref:Uncharacterized protein n=1 Tax=Tanacetum coccineum TaxID=301880 RepID=A0ABQ4ZZ56_9ASTR